MLRSRIFTATFVALVATGCGGDCPETTAAPAAACPPCTTAAPTPSATGPGLLGPGPLSGVWDTTWSAGSSVMTLSQNDTHIAGWFTNPEPIAPGAVAAIVSDNVIEGRGTDARSSGLLRLELGPDGRTFAGTWSNVDGSGGGAWTGVRR